MVHPWTGLLLASNTTRGGPGASLTGPPARLVYAHFVVLRKDQSWCSPSPSGETGLC